MVQGKLYGIVIKVIDAILHLSFFLSNLLTSNYLEISRTQLAQSGREINNEPKLVNRTRLNY